MLCFDLISIILRLLLQAAQKGLFKELVFSETQADVQHSDKNSVSGQTTVATMQPNSLAQTAVL